MCFSPLCYRVLKSVGFVLCHKEHDEHVKCVKHVLSTYIEKFQVLHKNLFCSIFHTKFFTKQTYLLWSTMSDKKSFVVVVFAMNNSDTSATMFKSCK